MEIVSLAPSNTEIICRLGMEDNIIATTSLCDYPEKMVKKKSIGGWSKNIDIQKVVELNPDVIMASDDLQDEIVLKLEERGFNVLHVKPYTLNEVYSSIREIGKNLGRQNKAKRVIENMKEEISRVDLKSKRIYCEEWMNPPMVSGNWIPGLVKYCNGDYFIDEGHRSRELNLERLKKFDPEYIFLNICGAGKEINTDLEDREGWSNLKAVKKQQIYVIDDALLNRPSPRLPKGVRKMENAIKEMN